MDLLVESVIFIIGTHNVPQISSRGFPRFDNVLCYRKMCLCPAMTIKLIDFVISCNLIAIL